MLAESRGTRAASRRSFSKRVIDQIDEPMTWEYMIREFSVEDSAKILLLEEFLNEVGKDGWELVSVATTPTENFTHLVYCKRASAIGAPAQTPF
jgi:hypothetical protein